MDLTLVRTRRPRPRPPGAAPAHALGCLLGVMVAALLTGCGNSGPTADPAPSPTHTVTADPAGPPSLPAAARKHTKAGAIAFVRHYIDLINYAQRTTDYDPLAGLDAPQCLSCRDARRHIHKLHRQHAKVTGGAWRVHGFFKVMRSGEPNEFSVPARITYGPQVIKSTAGTTRYRGGNNVITFFPAWSGDRWVLDRWTRAK